LDVKGIGFSSGIKMRGDLRIVVRSAATGERLKSIEIRNKIMFLAADVLVELLAQRATDPQPPVFPIAAGPVKTPDEIFSMRMGSSNVPASRSDTNLGAVVIGKELLDVNKVTGVPGEIELIASLGPTDANGATLQEAGLFTRGSAPVPSPSDPPGTVPGQPRLFARQIHPAVPKTAAISLDYSWRISFTA
jgi:hypothetical protein